MRSHLRAGAALAAAWLAFALLAGDAGARKFQMSGTWVIRNGQVFIPLQFAQNPTPTPATFGFHLSMGDLSGAFGFPNGPIPGAGGVSAAGSAPATLRIPRHRFVEDAMAAVPLAGITLVQITTNFGVDAPFATATLGPGGGPGSFTWCPSDPQCVAGGGMFSTDRPPTLTERPGRVVYVAGPNQFGGAMQIGLLRGGYTTALFSSAPYRVGYNKFGGPGSEIRNLAPGKGPADSPAMDTVFLERAFVTQPTMVPPAFNLILYPGP